MRSNDIYRKTALKYISEDLDFNVELPGDPGNSDYDALWKVLQAEKETVNVYLDLVKNAKSEKVKKVIMDITDEERVHMFEIQTLMDELASEHTNKLKAKAKKEIAELT